MGKARMASRVMSPRMTEASKACDRCRAMSCWFAVVRRTPDRRWAGAAELDEYMLGLEEVDCLLELASGAADEEGAEME